MPGASDLMQELTEEAAWSLARKWCDAWNRLDLDAIMEHYADDVEFNSPTIVHRWGHTDGWLRGKARLRASFEIGLKAPNLRFELIDVLVGMRAVCIIYRRETGTLVSDLVEFDEEGRGRRVFCCYSRVR
jgi:ketosteroid isomerase-like protein